MTTLKLLSELRSKDIEIWVDGDQLGYKAPKGALTPDLRKELVARKSEILALLRQTDTVTSFPSLPLKRVSRAGDLPLSFAQERLWFLHQFEPDSVAYSLPRRIRLKGMLNKNALEKTFFEMARRHETLRTTFHSIDGHPVQRIAVEPNIVFDTLDLRHLPDAEREAEARRLSEEDARKPFDLTRGPLLRIRLFQLEDQEHVLHLNRHHIISDLLSFGVMMREIAALYTAFIKDKPAHLPELPVQYADYAVWQRQWLQGEALEAQLNYWKDKLVGELPVLELPTDRPRPAVQTHRGAIESFTLLTELTEALQALSRREGVTLFMTLLAAFKTLLYRLTGQEDIIVGTATAGRNRKELEGLIGFFVNTLVMRTDLAGQPTFRELLGRVRETASGAYAHQDIPFEKLVEELSPERDLSRTPLFQVFFNHMVTGGDEAAQLPGLEAETVGGSDRESMFDMTLHVFEGQGGLAGRFEYNTDLLDAERIERMVGHFQTLLEGIIADPGKRIGDLPILDGDERRQLLVEWNRIEKDYPKDKTLAQLFEEQVKLSPDTIAVVYEETRLTYRELNSRANQLAYHLMSLGVGPEIMVGLYLERSLELVIGICGIIKAGGAYVPLDPSYPKERLAFILQDTAVPVLLTQQRLLEALPECGAKVICLDVDWEIIAEEKTDNLDSEATAENLAYVIYTSGSTGKPKGVLVTHGNVMRLMKATEPWYNFDQEDVWTMFHSSAFDFSVWEIWGALLYGARLVIVPYDVSRSPKDFYNLLVNERVTVLNQTPSAFYQLAQAEETLLPKNDLALRLIIFGGEALELQSLKPWFQRHGDKNPQLVNMYGITETTVHVTYRPISNEDVKSGQGSVIGERIPDLQLYVLDGNLQPVPIGVAGELFVGGAGLARGYLNRPELTVERFIPDPFSIKPGARLYKTGDIARYLLNGDLEYLGRADQQVQIRGFRVELGEIEVVLAGYSGVNMTVVMAREDRPGDKRLVAYIVPKVGEMLSVRNIRGFLKEKLPYYMVPAVIVVLESLPLTPNGKVDRRALPVPHVLRPDLQEAFVTPRSQSEELVAGIWSDVLDLEHIGVYDSFFELGGHSLLVVQIISRIREVFEVELAIRSLFEAPTVAGLTERIETARRSGEGLHTYPLQAVSRDQDLPLSFAQQRLWFLHHLEPDSVAYSMRHRVCLKGMLNKNALKKTYVELARRHEILRTTFDSIDGNPVLRIAAEPKILFDTVDLRHLPRVEREAEAKRLSAEDARKPFDLRRGPLFRVRLFQLEDEAHLLHFNMHHIISDGWSFDVMAREIAALYTAFIKDKPADLPELPVQYADYAVWQRQWLQGEALEAQLTYWKDNLGGQLPVLELPTDRPRPAVQTYRGAIESLALSKELTDALQAMSRREGVTLFMTLLAAFKTLLYRLTGQKDTIVGTPIAGRNRTELEGLIGFFVNTIVMRTDLSGNPTFRELLGRVRETALGAYAHQDMPFERLVEELSPERDLSRTPLFQVFFNHIVAMGDKAGALPGLEAEAIGGLDRESKFDLTLYVLEGEDSIELGSLYNTDLFDSWRMAEMLKQYEALLKQIGKNPGEKILQYSLVTPAVKDRLPDPIEPLPSQWEDAIHKRFSKQAQVGPDQLAVVDRSDSWTYAELDCRSNQLANFLLENAVQPGDVVAIYAHRSSSLVWSLLGILKAGAAFLLLDPAYPTQRLMDILQAAKPKAWFQIEAAGELAEELTKNVEDQVANCHLILPGRASTVGFGLLENYSDKDPEIAVGPDDLAYLAFTSGTTGEPKGIVGTHRPLSHFMNWHINTFSLNASDHFSMLSGLSHDPLLRDIFAPLWAGATLCIPDPDKMLIPAKLISWISARQITVAHMTPALSQVFAERVQEAESIKEILSSIRYIFFGGDVLTWRHVEKMKQIAPSAKFVNYYGATETPQAMGYHVVNAGKKGQFANGIPLGKGIEGVQLLILNAAGRLAGVGEIAEVHVRTPYLSKGYLNDETLTDAKFISNPYTNTGDDRIYKNRIYKTGDLGRYLPDGQVMFHGRSDKQVSLRGFRVELGEVEAALCRHPSVSEAVVVAREDQPGYKRLVAYIVLRRKPAPATRELNRFLKQNLPDYMIPSALVFLDELPLTPSGKVERKALPAPDRDRSQPAEALVAPRDEIELQLTIIWEKVLGVKNIGMNDNFFDLGGHSLLAVHLFARIRKIFGKDLPLVTLFQAPTIGRLARIIRQEGWSSPWSSLVPIQHGGSKPPFFCMHGCWGRALHFSDLARLLGPDQPFFGLSALGLEKGQVPHTQIEDMAAHYIKEIRTIQFSGPYYIGGSGAGCTIALEMAHQLESQGQKVALLVLMTPASLKPNRSSRTFSSYRKMIKIYFSLLIIVIKTRILLPTIKHVFFNRLLWHFSICHRFIPDDIHRWRRFVDDFGKARMNYKAEAYQGRITCFLHEEFSHNPTKVIGDWYDLAVGGLDVQFLPGNIFTMWKEPHVQILAEKLSACLNEAKINS